MLKTNRISGMIDITDKKKTARVAIAKATIVMSKETLQTIKAKKVPKGDVLEVARAAAIMAAKRVPELIPLCHPIELTNTKIDYKIIEPEKIEITSFVKAVDRTGAEMEALTAVTVCALTIYDMCKGVDRWMVIKDIMLLEKSGGKSGLHRRK